VLTAPRALLFTDSSWDAAGNRGADLDPGLAHFAFDMGNIGFANVWVSMGSFAAFSGWAVLVTGGFPAVVGLADGGQWCRVGIESVCLEDECVAAGLCTLLDLGHRGLYPIPDGKAPSAPTTESVRGDHT
jgi:hypothetical protein